MPKISFLGPPNWVKLNGRRQSESLCWQWQATLVNATTGGLCKPQNLKIYIKLYGCAVCFRKSGEKACSTAKIKQKAGVTARRPHDRSYRFLVRKMAWHLDWSWTIFLSVPMCDERPFNQQMRNLPSQLYDRLIKGWKCCEENHSAFRFGRAQRTLKLLAIWRSVL